MALPPFIPVTMVAPALTDEKPGRSVGRSAVWLDGTGERHRAVPPLRGRS